MPNIPAPSDAEAVAASCKGCALWLASGGAWLFPVERNGKRPAIKGWQQAATRDPATFGPWFDGAAPFNVGIFTGRFGDDAGALVVIDIDCRPGKDGNEALVELELQGCEFPATRTTYTPSGGKHLFYRAPRPVKQGANVLGPGLDIRSDGGYVLGPGSTINGVAYEGDDTPIADAPAWLIERCGAARTPRERGECVAEIAVPPDRAAMRASRYLQHDAPVASEGSRNDTGFKVACRVRDEGVNRDDALALMTEHWNPRLSPPLEDAELEHVVNSAYRYGENAQGAAAPEAHFAPIAAASSPDWLTKMNARYAVTTHHNKTMVHEIVHDRELGHPCHQWITFDDLRRRHMAKFVAVSRNGKTVPLDTGTAWLEHPQRRQYEAEAFLPGQDAGPHVLNLWRGFAIEPAPGSWSRLRDHMHRIICNGDDALFAYVLGWMAALVQRPAEAGQVALVLQGGEGTGKGTLGAALLGMFGQHGLHITQSKHLTGAFNAHLRDKVMVFADEAFFAGNPEHRGPLYSLITEDRLQIEAKGVDAKTARNVLHVVMATNEDWAVPAGVSARRFCVLRLSEARRQDTTYFRSLRQEMQGGGIAAMLRDLLAHDMAAFNPYAAPSTAALAAQKLMSLKGVEAWLLDCLQRGAIGGTDWAASGLTMAKADAHTYYSGRSRDFRELAPRDMATWARIVRAVLGPAVQERKLWAGGRRSRQLILSNLADCRAAFERHLQHSIEWETDGAAPSGTGNAH